jgi:hypothetical protein
MKFDEPLTRPDLPTSMLNLLSVAGALMFKIWKLSSPLRFGATALALILVGLIGWYCWVNRNNPIVTVDFGNTGGDLWRLTWGGAALTAVIALVVNRLPAFVRNILRFADYRKTAYEIIVGAGMGFLGWLAAGLHLLVFDRWYLWLGSQKRLLDSETKISNE